MTVLAHGGGAPEAAMIGLPLLLFVLFVLLERRARRRESPPAAAGNGTSGTAEPGADAADPGHPAA